MTKAKLDYIAKPLRSMAIPLDSINIDPANARKHDLKNLESIQKSLKRFGQRMPIVVQREGMLVRAGNGRTRVAREMGWTHIAAVVVDESDAEAAAFAIVDNRSAELAEWDFSQLSSVLKELKELPSFDIESLGFEDYELDPLLQAAWEVPEIDESEEFEATRKKVAMRLAFTEEDTEFIRKAVQKYRGSKRDDATEVQLAETLGVLCAEYLEEE